MKVFLLLSACFLLQNSNAGVVRVANGYNGGYQQSSYRPYASRSYCDVPRTYYNVVQERYVKIGESLNCRCPSSYKSYGPPKITCMPSGRWNTDEPMYCMGADKSPAAPYITININTNSDNNVMQNQPSNQQVGHTPSQFSQVPNPHIQPSQQSSGHVPVVPAAYPHTHAVGAQPHVHAPASQPVHAQPSQHYGYNPVAAAPVVHAPPSYATHAHHGIPYHSHTGTTTRQQPARQTQSSSSISPLLFYILGQRLGSSALINFLASNPIAFGASVSATGGGGGGGFGVGGAIGTGIGIGAGGGAGAGSGTATAGITGTIGKK